MLELVFVLTHVVGWMVSAPFATRMFAGDPYCHKTGRKGDDAHWDCCEWRSHPPNALGEPCWRKDPEGVLNVKMIDAVQGSGMALIWPIFAGAFAVYTIFYGLFKGVQRIASYQRPAMRAKGEAYRTSLRIAELEQAEGIRGVVTDDRRALPRMEHAC
jgi:hypothetical protein